MSHNNEWSAPVFMGPEPSQTAYQVQTSDLMPAVRVCNCCGGPRAALDLAIAPELQGTARRGAARYDEIAGFTRYLGAGECGHCQLSEAVARVGARAVLSGPIIDPVAAELAALRAQLDAPKPTPEAPVVGGLFKPGRVTVSPAALAAVAMVHVPRYDASVAGLAEMAREFVPLYLARHVRGDFGKVGKLAAGNVVRGLSRGVLADRLDRNVASVEQNLGPVLSNFRLDVRRSEMLVNGELSPERVVESFNVSILSELGLVPLTLVGLSSELPPD